MTAASRRLWLYGLLLLLPALAVGGLALGLLAREQDRLAEREQAARDSRRAAVETRARLIAENIELLVGDVQSALMATLLEAPAGEPRAFLSEWQATNPLVRDVFRATAEGHPVWGATGEPLRSWLNRDAPWRVTPAPSVPGESLVSSTSQTRQQDEAPALAAQALRDNDPARRDISANIVQYQRARQEIQEVAKLKNYADIAAKSASESQYSSAGALPPAAPVAPTAEAGEDVPMRKVPVAPDGTVAAVPQTELRSVFSAPPPVAPKDFDAAKSEVLAAVSDPITRSGWTPWSDASGLHLFGWRELPDRTVVGLELRLDAIKARLGEVFPAAPEEGEAYALRDSSGTTWHAVGNAGLPATLEVSLAAATLPGWTVVGAFAATYDSSAGGGFFALGAALVGLLVLAILAAGALLVRQARISDAEAALKTSFVANVSHELKTPLTTIRLYAELLAQGRVRDEARRADYLVTIGRETQRLARLVGNVLDFSRLEQGKKKYDRAGFDLAAELRRLAATHAPRLAEAGLELRVESPGSLAITSDRDAVEQIVLNLLDNACKYAAQGGEVCLSLTPPRAAGADVELRVADRGPGVPAEQRERVFEKFHRVDDRLTAEKGGAGLGLSIARRLARGLGGELRCGARAGGGAEFVLSLPSFVSP